MLDSGRLRVAEKTGGKWVTNEWAKKAVLLSFRLEDNDVIDDGYTRYFDKVPSKFAGYELNHFCIKTLVYRYHNTQTHTFSNNFGKTYIH